MNFTIAVTYKASLDQKCGIRFGKEDGVFIVKNIHEDGLFEGTDLKAGQRLITINNKPTKEMSSEDLLDILRNTVGYLVVLACDADVPQVIDNQQYVVSFTQKETLDTRVGLAMKKDNVRKGVVRIHKVVEGGLLDGTGLVAGQELISINGNLCRAEELDAITDIFKTIEGPMLVVARA